MVDEVEHVVGETSRRQKNSVSLGYVTGVNYTANTITVTLDTGQENVQCRWLAKRWGTGSAGAIDSEWWAPEIKECVLILEVAAIEKVEYVIIGSMPEAGKGSSFDKTRYATDSKKSKNPKIKSVDIFKEGDTQHQITYSDGTSWSYDKGKGKHKIEMKMKDDKKEQITFTVDATKQTINLTAGDKQKLKIDITGESGKESIEVTRDKDKMVMNKDGFELTCEKEIKITSKKDVTIKGKSIKLDATSMLELTSSEATLKASGGIALKSAKVDAAP